ncbi:DNA repair protein xrcc2, partial [Goodea atripinnis]
SVGKTELLYHLLCRCVMPETAGGLEVDVVFVDTDYSLDMLRLVSILDSRLNAGGTNNMSRLQRFHSWMSDSDHFLHLQVLPS